MTGYGKEDKKDNWHSPKDYRNKARRAGGNVHAFGACYQLYKKNYLQRIQKNC